MNRWMDGRKEVEGLDVSSLRDSLPRRVESRKEPSFSEEEQGLRGWRCEKQEVLGQ